jgi:hypothetical protein
MADTSFDLLVYLRTAPVVTIESGIVLARTLLSVMPKSMPAHVKKSAAKLGRVADAAQAALSERQRELVPPQGESSRDIDSAADQVWSLLRDLLDALSRLPDKYERAQKARALLATIFPEGTGFLRLSYSEQFVMMDITLKRIDSEGLAKSVDALVGPEPLQEIRAVHPRYAAMVAGRLKEAAPAASLLEHVRTLQRTIVEYATAVASAVDSDDPSTITLAREALRPIDNHREQVSSGKRPSLEDPSPASPTEPVPPPSDS